MSQLVARVVAAADSARARHPSLRRGQALMNALSEHHQLAYSEITNTEADCFYRDSSIQTFFQKVSEYG